MAHDLAKIGAGVRFSLFAPDKCGNKYISLFPTCVLADFVEDGELV